MRRIDIPDSEIGRHFQTFSVADEGLGGDDVFLCESTLSMNTLVNVNAPVVATTSWLLHFTAPVVA